MTRTHSNYSRVPMDDSVPTPWHLTTKDEEHKGRNCCHRQLARIVCVLLVVMVVLIGLLIHFAISANSSACKHGLAAQQKCQNTTQLLQHQLTQAQESFRGAKAQAVSCKQTVVNLEASLKMEKDLIQELKGTIKKLNEMLQKTLSEVEELRKEEASIPTDSYDSTNSAATPSPWAATMLLLLPLTLQAVL